MKYASLFMDNEGESHFKDVFVEFEAINFAPPAPSVGLSVYMAVCRMVFFKIPPGWFGDWHPAPRRQFFCCLSGEVELTASDGEKRVFRQGDVFLLEDTAGKGHQTRVLGGQDYVATIVQLA